MLKPEQIKAHRFISNTKGSYEVNDVDNFFAEVCESFEQMFRENAELVSKLTPLAKLVAQYKEDEDNIKKALLTAERMSSQIRKEAEEEVAQKQAKAEQTYTEVVSAAQNRADVLETKARVEAEKLTEESQKNAQERITNAEKTASAMISDAEQKAAQIVENAKHFAQQELDRINHEIKVNTVTLEALNEEVTSFKTALLDSYRKHIEYITTLPREEDFVKPDTQSAVAAVEAQELTQESDIIKAADEIASTQASAQEAENPTAVAEAEYNILLDEYAEDAANVVNTYAPLDNPETAQPAPEEAEIVEQVPEQVPNAAQSDNNEGEAVQQMSIDLSEIQGDIGESSVPEEETKPSLFRGFFKK